MRINETHLGTVVFLAVEERGADGVIRTVPRATGFFVIVHVEPSPALAYVVTARHCVQETGGRDFYVRVNTTTGFDDVPTQASAWYMHDSADVAVTVFAPTSRDVPYEITALPLAQFVDAGGRFQPDLPGITEPRPKATVEVGHELYFVGLFVPHAGQEKNLPIARFGHVSRLSGESIAVKRSDGTRERLDGYLAECHSWGGHSGSPVFWRIPLVHLRPIQPPEDFPVSGPVALQEMLEVTPFLGLVSAHFNIAQRAETEGDVLGTITTEINAGIAVVTPAEAIRELLMRDDVVGDRQRRLEKDPENDPAATFDSRPA